MILLKFENSSTEKTGIRIKIYVNASMSVAINSILAFG